MLERGVRELHLPLDSAGSGNAEILARADGVLEQRALADARRSMHDQDATFLPARGLEQPVEHGTLALAPEQVASRNPNGRGRSARHRPDNMREGARWSPRTKEFRDATGRPFLARSIR